MLMPRSPRLKRPRNAAAQNTGNLSDILLLGQVSPSIYRRDFLSLKFLLQDVVEARRGEQF